MDPQSYQNNGSGLPQQPDNAAQVSLPGQSSYVLPAQEPPMNMTISPTPVFGTTVLRPPVPVYPMNDPAVVNGQEPVYENTSNTATNTPTNTMDTQPGTLTDTSTEAADADVIEKEWVTRAKQVVAETRTDPFKQVREINKIKAEYMKKRYNKDTKLLDA